MRAATLPPPARTAAAKAAAPAATPAVAPPAPPLDPRRWLQLAVALVGPFLGVLDLFVVNVSIPAIRGSLGATFAEVQLVIAGYGLAYAVCLITGGRLGDIHGRRRMFLVGLGAFTAASVLCGGAATANALIFWRVVQGVAAATMYPQAMALIQVLFAGEERRKAFSLLGVAVGLGSILGQSLGGFLVDANFFGLGWRSVFLINLPIGLLALAAAARLLPESRSENARRLDLGGVGIVSLGLFLFSYPLVEGREQSWPAWAWLMLAASGPTLWAFYKFEQWKAAREGEGAALVAPVLFRDRAFVAGLGVILVYFAGHASMLLMLTLYLQLSLGLSPTHAGWMFVPFSTGFLAGSFLSGQVGARLGRGMLHLGAGIVAAGLVFMLALRVAHHAGAGFGLELALALYGVGRGFMTTPIFHTVLGGVRPANAGAASGVLATAQQVAHSAGMAAIGAVLFSMLPAGRPAPADYSYAFGLACAINLGLLVVASLLVLLIPRSASVVATPAPAL